MENKQKIYQLGQSGITEKDLERTMEEHLENASFDEVIESLEGMTERYCDLINSGDAGNWNPEEEDVVIKARKILQKYKQKEYHPCDGCPDKGTSACEDLCGDFDPPE